MSEKRRRGRPKGSGIDDSESLVMIAMFMIDDPSLKPSTAMKRVLRTRDKWPSTDGTLLRRWQEKWKCAGSETLQRVRDERKIAEAQRQTSHEQKVTPTAWELFANHRQYMSDDALRRASGIFGSEAIRRMGEHIDREAARASSWHKIQEHLTAQMSERRSMFETFAQTRQLESLVARLWERPALSKLAMGEALAKMQRVADQVSNVRLPTMPTMPTMPRMPVMPTMPKLPKLP